MNIKSTIYVLTILILVSCGQKNMTEDNKGNTLTMSEKDKIKNDVELIKTEPSGTFDRALIQQFVGPRFFLKKKGESYTFEDACDFRDFDISIAETAEYSNDWELTFYGETYSITGIKETKGDIGLTTDKSKTFVFRRTENPMVWGFLVNGNDNIRYLAKKHELENFNIRACTDINKIMNNTSTTWYQLTEKKGILSIEVPCEDAPAGITIDGSFIDFWSGSDPYPIVSMSKILDKVTIVYTSVFDETKRESIIMHSPGHNLIKFGKGVYEDNYYVAEVALKEYPEILEPCE